MGWNFVVKKVTKDPFRLFFPLGWALALAGVAAWAPFAWGETRFYPGGFHAIVMSRGFVSSFIFGFLMTSIPRFTETENARGWEVLLGFAAVLLGIAIAPFGRTPAASALSIFQIAVVIVFIGRRFRKRKNNPPGAFLFVGLGLLLGAAGSLMEGLALAEWWEVPVGWLELGRLFSFYGMVLALVLGVGSRLIPGILGWSEIVASQKRQYERPVSFMAAVPRDLRFGAMLFVLSFLVEVFVQSSGGRAVRAAVVSYLAFRYWRIHRVPPQRTWMSWAVIAAGWNIVLGEVLAAIFPTWGIDGKHLVFVGGFSLLSLLVAARVTLAHGEGLALESRWWPYVPIAGLVLVSSVSRGAVHWIPQSYFPHLAYAALLWLVGSLIWGKSFLPRMLKI